MKNLCLVIILFVMISCTIQEEPVREEIQFIPELITIETFPEDSVSYMKLLNFIQSDSECMVARCFFKEDDQKLLYNAEEIESLDSVREINVEQLRQSVKVLE